MSNLIPSTPAPGGEFLFYQTEDGRTRLQVRVQDETVWLSLNQLAELFQRDKSVISRHINNVFDEGELGWEATVAKSATVQTEGGKQVTRGIEFFNLDVIISGLAKRFGDLPLSHSLNPPVPSAARNGSARRCSSCPSSRGCARGRCSRWRR